jgi:ABC-type oligopeptide transport system substrate-binding subunit
MKTKFAALLLAVAALLTNACEQHKWSETSKLFKEGGHGENVNPQHAGTPDTASAEPKPTEEKKKD